MWIKFIAFRNENQIDMLRKEFHLKDTELEALQQFYPRGYCGVDNHGRPIYIDKIGSIELESLVE